jgi:hypothetical protein
MKKDAIKKKVIQLFRMNYYECFKAYNSLYQENFKELDAMFSFINSLLSNCYFTYCEDLQISWHFGSFSFLDVEETEGLFSYVMIRMILERKHLLTTDEDAQIQIGYFDKIAESKDKCTNCKLYRLIERIW